MEEHGPPEIRTTPGRRLYEHVEMLRRRYEAGEPVPVPHRLADELPTICVELGLRGLISHEVSLPDGARNYILGSREVLRFHPAARLWSLFELRTWERQFLV